MTNYVAFWIIAIIAATLLADLFYFDWNLFLIAGRTLAFVVQWLAFWR